jgi:hypothetical protein
MPAHRQPLDVPASCCRKKLNAAAGANQRAFLPPHRAPAVLANASNANVPAQAASAENRQNEQVTGR